MSRSLCKWIIEATHSMLENLIVPSPPPTTPPHTSTRHTSANSAPRSLKYFHDSSPENLVNSPLSQPATAIPSPRRPPAFLLIPRPARCAGASESRVRHVG